MINKICSKCNVEKLISNFKKRGNNSYTSHCKLCHNEKQRENYSNKFRQNILSDEKTCVKCNIKKNILEFNTKTYKSGAVIIMPKCKTCVSNNIKTLQKKARIKWWNNIENREKYNKKRRKYYLNNKDKISYKYKEIYQKNIYKERERSKLYRVKNLEIVKEKRKIKARLQRQLDPVFKIKQNISRAIRSGLHKLGKSKSRLSFCKYLSYTVDDLKQYLELQFESWMNWSNYGKYIKSKWDDNDQSTWTWQIDHIIPQSTFLYVSMEEENFKKCWALENLRPYSAKQNLLDSNKREK